VSLTGSDFGELLGHELTLPTSRGVWKQCGSTKRQQTAAEFAAHPAQSPF
jgi:hypothetical protein